MGSSRSSAIRAIFFDFDGVLVDSEPLHYRCWAEVLASRGMGFSWDYYSTHFIGASNQAMLERLCRHFGQPYNPAFFEECYRRKRALYCRRAPAACRTVPELLDFITNRSGDYKLAVVSSSSRREVEPQLVRQGIRRHFQAVICEEDVEKLKPEPAPYLEAWRRVNGSRPRIAKRECLVVEDSGPGALAGRRAGMQVLRVSGPGAVWGLLKRQDWRA